MKQTKKQSGIKKIFDVILFIFIISFIFILIQRAYFPTTKQYCNNFPDKCVCVDDIHKQEITQKELISGNLKDFCVEDYYFRLKTQAEFDIDDCNSNPREDDLCKCEEYFECFTNALFDCENYTIGLGVENQETCIPKYKIGNCTFSQGAYKFKECLKSRPKTDYEKHPEDYVAETNEVEIKTGELFCENIIFEGFEQFGYNPTCFEGTKTINQTTYRLKTECEKGKC